MTVVVSADYYLNGAALPALGRLQRELGAQDQDLQFIELALRVLAEQSAAASGSSRAFLTAAYKAHGLPVGSMGIKAALGLAHVSYIVSTHAIVDRFLRDIISEYCAFNRIPATSWRRQDGARELDPLAQVLVNTPDAANAVLRALPESRILNYYRLIRNYAIHGDPNIRRGIDKIHADLTADATHIAQLYKGLRAPNRLDSLGFNDFMLYSRATRYWAHAFSNSCPLTSTSIAAFYLADPEARAHVVKRRSSNAGLLAASRHLLRKHIGSTRADREGLTEALRLQLQNIPTHRERNREKFRRLKARKR
jgi:hypothetical protein